MMQDFDNFEWVKLQMPKVYLVGKKLDKLVNSQSILINLPLTWETLCLIDSIRQSVKNIIVIPLSSGKYSSLQHGVFKYLKKWRVKYFETASAKNKISALKLKPDIILDCTFSISQIGFSKKLISPKTFIIEDTRTGGLRLREFFKERKINNPFYVLDDNKLKKDFENEKGIGYSIIASLMKMGIFLENKKVMVIGFGPVGRGIAKYMKSLGADVLVNDIDLELAARANKLGYKTKKIADGLKIADIIVTSTGKIDVVNANHLLDLKNNVILVNAGAEQGEWDRSALVRKYKSIRLNQFAVCYCLPSGKHILELGGGNSFNLVSGVSVSEFLDTTFSLATKVMDRFLHSNQISGEFKI